MGCCSSKETVCNSPLWFKVQNSPLPGHLVLTNRLWRIFWYSPQHHSRDYLICSENFHKTFPTETVMYHYLTLCQTLLGTPPPPPYWSNTFPALHLNIESSKSLKHMSLILLQIQTRLFYVLWKSRFELHASSVKDFSSKRPNSTGVWVLLKYNRLIQMTMTQHYIQ